MSLKQNIQEINNELSSTNCRLIAVSKTKPISTLQEAYDLGIRIFGENKVQEMVDKEDALPKDIQWHMIGHLQTNKVKYIAPFVHMIHSVDSLKLLSEINKRAKQNERVIDCLFQMHIAAEDTKFGLDRAELEELLTSETFAQMENIRMKGLMGMATFTEDEAKIRREFQHLKKIFDEVQATKKLHQLDFTEISMGMSGDYAIAIEEGSTLVRVGSKIFGERNYA